MGHDKFGGLAAVVQTRTKGNHCSNDWEKIEKFFKKWSPPMHDSRHGGTMEIKGLSVFNMASDLGIPILKCLEEVSFA